MHPTSYIVHPTSYSYILVHLTSYVLCLTSYTLQVKKGWAVLREAQQSGDFVQTIAGRVRAGREGMRFVPTKGGWTPEAKGALGCKM